MRDVNDRQSWLSLHERSGDRTIGQTLIRLARLAASAHRYEVAMDLMDKDRRDDRQHGLGPAIHPPRKDAHGAATRQGGAVHKEVNR